METLLFVMFLASCLAILFYIDNVDGGGAPTAYPLVERETYISPKKAYAPIRAKEIPPAAQKRLPEAPNKVKHNDLDDLEYLIRKEA